MSKQLLQRRQRRLVEQHQNQQGGATGGVIGNEIGKSSNNKGLPQILPVNGSSIHAGKYTLPVRAEPF